MKIKLDENLPRRVSLHLAILGHEAHTVHDEELAGHPDSDIWDVAQREGRFVVTQDVGFVDIRDHPPGTHHGILFLRLGDVKRDVIVERTMQLFSHEDVESWKGCVIVASMTKLRVRRPTA